MTIELGSDLLVDEARRGRARGHFTEASKFPLAPFPPCSDLVRRPNLPPFLTCLLVGQSMLMS